MVLQEMGVKIMGTELFARDKKKKATFPFLFLILYIATITCYLQSLSD